MKLIVENFVEMVDKSVPEKVNFNLSEIKQSELKPFDILDLVSERR